MESWIDTEKKIMMIRIRVHVRIIISGTATARYSSVLNVSMTLEMLGFFATRMRENPFCERVFAVALPIAIAGTCFAKRSAVSGRRKKNPFTDEELANIVARTKCILNNSAHRASSSTMFSV